MYSLASIKISIFVDRFHTKVIVQCSRTCGRPYYMQTGEQLFRMRPMMCDQVQVRTRSNCPPPTQSNFNHYFFVQAQPSVTRSPFQVFPPPSLPRDATLTSHILHRQHYIPTSPPCSFGDSPKQLRPPKIHIQLFHLLSVS
jgi:hypothetical protein